MLGNFTFIHAADIHLDSPLHGLSRKDEAFSQLVRGATRKAFSNVVDLAIEEGAAFVVIAGDLYDGAWKDQSTGQFAIAQLARLARAGIRSVIVFGNHDADSRVTRHLTAPEGVYKLKSAKCETVLFDDLGVAIHGRSYKEAATTENIASTYCPPVAGLLNVALLHTALDGHEGHANYAPCSLGELQAAGHDYWALGHVHDHAIRSDHPHVVFSGNTQGRHIRETGSKGAVVVRVEEGAIRHVEHRATDEVRWAHARVDAIGARDPIEALAAIQRELRPAVLGANGRPMAARVSIEVDGALAQRLTADPAWFEAEVRGHAAGVSDALWIERVKVIARDAAVPIGLPLELQELLAQALDDPDCLRAVENAVAPLTAKLPADIDDPDIAPLLSSARARDGEALVRAARALVEARLGEGAD
jgi:predicted MPP superfamily phosphohydrolase